MLRIPAPAGDTDSLRGPWPHYKRNWTGLFVLVARLVPWMVDCVGLHKRNDLTVNIIIKNIGGWLAELENRFSIQRSPAVCFA